MSSQNLPDPRERHGLRHTIRNRVKSVKDALKNSTVPRQSSGQPESSISPGQGSQLLSISTHSIPELATGTAPTQSGQRAVTALPRPSTQTTPLTAEINTTTDPKNSGRIAWSRLNSTLRTLEGSVKLFPPLKTAVDAFIGCLDVVQEVSANRTDYEELANEFQSLAEVLSQYTREFDSDSSNGSIANIAQCIQAQLADIKRYGEQKITGRLLDATYIQEDVVRRYRQVECLFRQLQCDMAMRTKSDAEKQLETTLLRGMFPVDDARYNSSYSMTIRRRGCTAETREAIHQTLQNWTTNPKGEKIYWMNGMAGTGKTTIAYSFCEWLEKTNRLGASYFCSRISSNCRSPIRIVPTIAYQLAHYSPALRAGLFSALKDHPDAGALNVMQQFEKLINRPMINAKDAIPESVVVVIDALDECDDTYSVSLFLDVLLKFAKDLPVKFFVASRPEHVLRDRMISQGGTARAIVHLHDIEQSIVEADIKKYLTESLSLVSPLPTSNQIGLLAKRAGKLFIYAATVVRYIYPGVIPVDSTARLETVLNAVGAQESEGNDKYKDLDSLYTTVLDAAFNGHLGISEKGRIQGVLWTIVSAMEPVSAATLSYLASLTERHVWLALQPLRSVLHVPDSEGQELISVLHASFPEYMLDHSRSKRFHCDGSKSSEIMAHRCFHIMRSELRFNICNLESSYLVDGQVGDLETRAARCISSTLSYASRHWGSHLTSAPATDSTRNNLLEFLSEQLLFWMEVLNLSQCIGIGAPMMHKIQTWLRQMGDTQETVLKQVADTRNFVTWFSANSCSQSTPHIYISALSSCAKSNWVYQHYSERIQGLVNILSKGDDAVLAMWSPESLVYSIAISPDGNRIAVGNEDGNIHVYDMHTGGIVLGPFKGHKAKVRSVAFSPDGMLIASGSADETAIVWDAQTGSIIIGPLYMHAARVRSVAFSPDGNRIVSGGGDNNIYVWDTLAGTIIIGPLHGHTEDINSVAFSPNGSLIASGSSDKTIRLWDANTGAAVSAPFKGHEDIIWAVSFSPDGSHIASGGDYHTVRLWDVLNGDMVELPLGDEELYSPIRSTTFSLDGSLLLAAGGTTTTVWDMRTRSPIIGPLHAGYGWVYSAVFSPDNTRIVSGGGNAIVTWDMQLNDMVAHQRSTPFPLLGPVSFFPDCTQLISHQFNDGFRIWDLHQGDITPQPLKGLAQFRSIDTIAISPQGAYVAASAEGLPIQVWNSLTGELVCDYLGGHRGSVTCLAFSPDGTHLCSGSDDSTLIIWAINTGIMAGQPYQGHEGTICSVTYSPAGTLIASGGTDHSIRIWDTTTGTLVHTLGGHQGSVLSVVFSPDGGQIISGGTDGSIRKWDVRAGESSGILFGSSDQLLPHEPDINSTFGQHSNKGPDPVNCICISPNGAHLVAAFNSKIRVFDIHTTEIISDVTMRECEEAHWVGFSPDGSDILSVSQDSRLRYQFLDFPDAPSQSPNIIRLWRVAPPLGQQGSPYDTGYWSYKSDGRILSPEGLVIWVPPDLIPHLKVQSKSYYNPYVWSHRVGIDMGRKDLCIGDKWTECYIHEGWDS